MGYIRNIIEPEELYLCWMATDESERRRFRVGKLHRQEEGNVILEYYHDSQELKEAAARGFRGYPAFPDIKKSYHQGVMEAFMRRLPPRSRRDFHNYAAWYGIPPDRVSEMSDFALPGYTGAKVANDGFSLVHPFDTPMPFEFMLEVAGYRDHGELPADEIRKGMELTFQPEPQNPDDPEAIRIMHNGSKIGYVDKGRTPLIHRWMEQERYITAHVERINGITERKLIYVWVEVSALEKATA